MNIERKDGKCFATIDGERTEITRRLANKTARLHLGESEVKARFAANELRKQRGGRRRR